MLFVAVLVLLGIILKMYGWIKKLLGIKNEGWQIELDVEPTAGPLIVIALLVLALLAGIAFMTGMFSPHQEQQQTASDEAGSEQPGTSAGEASPISLLLISASSDGNLALVKQALNAGADINATNRGWTALMMASRKGRTDIVKLLLDKGADVNATTNKGDTALIMASQNGHTDIVKLLLDKGADVDVKDSNGWTALSVASPAVHADIVKLLQKQLGETRE